MEKTSLNQLKDHFQNIESKIKASCLRAGRDPGEVSLLPISKTKPPELIREAVALGYKRFGENKVQETAIKAEALKDLEIRWCLVGHLQTNKVKHMLPFTSELQSLDSLKLAQELDRRLQRAGRSLDVLVQVNTSQEEQKYGLLPDEVLDFSKELKNFSALKVKGLMTLAVFSEEEDQVRACFKKLKRLQEQVRQDSSLDSDWSHLSMGMSGDFEIAIEEGSTEVRVGQALFGVRT